ncbi:MAG: hypothetical protein AABW59_04380 [archaeon]
MLMRISFIFLALVLLASFSFADSIYLVKYYSNDSQSHACNPNSAECAYLNSVIIDSKDSAMCASGVKVLGLSGGTNAHAEKNDQSNYSTSICMKSDIFTSGTCSYTAAGANCPAEREDCVFALSSATNAHLSKCGVFTNELKFCCKKGVATTIIPDETSKSCISTVSVENAYLDSDTKFSFTCLPAADINIIIFDSQGNILAEGGVLSKIPCGAATSTATFKVISDRGAGTYLARFVAPACSRDEYFAVKDTKDQTFAIPDNNFALAFLVAFTAGAFILFSRRKK